MLLILVFKKRIFAYLAEGNYAGKIYKGKAFD